jgi:hypothetical protein
MSFLGETPHKSAFTRTGVKAQEDKSTGGTSTGGKSTGGKSTGGTSTGGTSTGGTSTYEIYSLIFASHGKCRELLLLLVLLALFFASF